MVEGLAIMLRVLINLLYTHTMPNNHYCSTYMMLYPHLMAKHCLTISRKSESEATGDINSTYGELILRNKFPISGMILSEVSNEVFHK